MTDLRLFVSTVEKGSQERSGDPMPPSVLYPKRRVDHRRTREDQITNQGTRILVFLPHNSPPHLGKWASTISKNDLFLCRVK